VNLVLEGASTYDAVGYTFYHTIWNEKHDISALISAAGVKSLVETELDEVQTAALIGEGDIVLRTCAIAYDTETEMPCTLRFHLGDEYIGKKVEIRTLVDGEVVRVLVEVDSNGMAVLTNARPGMYAVVLVK